MDAPPLNEEELNFVYNWVDQIPLSRPKKSINRDFADGVLVAEIVAHYFPKYVELHNYIGSSSATQKLANWNTLNAKVFKKINFQVSKTDIEHIITAAPDAIERVLKLLYSKIQAYLNKPKQTSVSNSNISLFKQKEELKVYGVKSFSNNKEVNSLMNGKEQTIKQLKETIEILELKVKKMDQLLKVKDKKIETLINKLQQAGVS